MVVEIIWMKIQLLAAYLGYLIPIVDAWQIGK